MGSQIWAQVLFLDSIGYKIRIYPGPGRSKFVRAANDFFLMKTLFRNVIEKSIISAKTHVNIFSDIEIHYSDVKFHAASKSVSSEARFQLEMP